jgi:hypothetical protein
MDGVRNWRSMGKMHFQAKGIKPSLKKKIAGAYRELERVQQERDILKKLI